MVGAAGIEPAPPCSQSRCAASALRSDMAASPMPTAPATMAALLFGFRTNQTIAAPVPATTRGRAWSLPVRGGKRKARPQVALGPGLLIGKDIQQPFIRRDFMKNETIELVDEKIDHLYAMQMAGYSTICGLLFAQLKQNSFGRTLSRDELEECLLWGREALADSYLESLQSRQASSQNRRPKNV